MLSYPKEINKIGWKRAVDSNTGFIIYVSTHKQVRYVPDRSKTYPEWKIVKEPKGYMLYYFDGHFYERLIGFMHHKRLYDVQYYCDVEVERFRADYR